MASPPTAVPASHLVRANRSLTGQSQLGVFLCMRCASIHRKLGTHISKVKSLSMDGWSNEQVEVSLPVFPRFHLCHDVEAYFSGRRT